jgi:hypothetical protein
MADHTAVRFTMKDGAKTIVVLVSNPALDNVDAAPQHLGGYLDTFKQYRKSFERLASDKYDRGHVEADGTVCIRAIDLPPVCTN